MVIERQIIGKDKKLILSLQIYKIDTKYGNPASVEIGNYVIILRLLSAQADKSVVLSSN